MKKYRTPLVLSAMIVINIAVLAGVFHWQTQKRQQFEKELRDAQRYDGFTGKPITIFDEKTDRWTAEMKEESTEVILHKLTDMEEITAPMLTARGESVAWVYSTGEWRERSFYYKDIGTILGNRRFRAAYERLQKTNKKKAAEMLTKNIRDNLAALRVFLQESIDRVSRGEHTNEYMENSPLNIPESPNSYRRMAPGYATSHMGKKYGMFSYIMLASLLEIREVRPAVEEVIALAKEEYKLFNSVDGNYEVLIFKSLLLYQSLYSPSLLVTAAFCDPTWKTAEKKMLPHEKLVEEEVVDWQSRVLEHEKFARDGLLPVVPHEKMIKIRYYRGITDEEFNAFFGE